MAPANDRRKFPQLTQQEVSELKGSGMNEEMIGSLQEMTQWFDQVIDTWSPDEQNKFWGEFDELNDTLNKMSPDEREKYTQEMLTKAFSDLGVQEQQPAQPVIPEPIVTPKVEPKKVAPKVEETEQDKAFKMLTALSNSIQNFLNKVQASPDFAIKVEGWARKNEIPQWTPSLKWETLKTDLEQFDALIQQIKLRNTKTGEYRFLNELIKNKALIDNLTRTQAILAQYEPQIDIASFGIVSLTKNSKLGIQKVVNALSEALYTLNVRPALLKVIEQFEPEAKKIREQQAALEKQAAQQFAVRPQQNRPTVISGYPDEGYPLGTVPQYPSMQQRSSGDNSSNQAGQFKGPQASEKSETKKPDAAAAGAKKSDKKKKELVLDKAAEELYKNLSGAVQDIVRMIETSKLRNLPEYFKKPDSKLDTNLATSVIPNLNEKLTTASYYAKALKRKITRLDAEQRSHFNKETRELKAEYLDLFRSVITSVQSAANNPTLNADKRFAYFGKGAESEATKNLNASVYLDEVSQRLQELINEL